MRRGPSGRTPPGPRIAEASRGLQLAGLTPAAFHVLGAHRGDVGYGADDRAHLHLLVPLDRRLSRAAVFLTPHERHFRARLGVLWIEHRERQHLALVGAVADPRGHPGELAIL